MEMFGIILSFPAAFVLLTGYSIFLNQIVAPFAKLSSFIVILSTAVLFGFAVEVIFLLIFGIIETQNKIGPIYYPIHLFFFFTVSPALTAVIVLRIRSVFKWAIIFIASVIATVLVNLQYVVAETLTGIK